MPRSGSNKPIFPLIQPITGVIHRLGDSIWCVLEQVLPQSIAIELASRLPRLASVLLRIPEHLVWHGYGRLHTHSITAGLPRDNADEYTRFLLHKAILAKIYSSQFRT
jgi:hypothetical protein